MEITKEAMGLAGMNPVMGISSKAGSFIVNVTNHDKDLDDDTDWKDGIGLTKSLDMDDNLYGIDKNGKFFAKHKFDVMKRKDIVEAYECADDMDDVFYMIQEELNMPYEERPSHPRNFIYTLATGHEMITEDQMKFDNKLKPLDEGIISKFKKAFGLGNFKDFIYYEVIEAGTEKYSKGGACFFSSTAGSKPEYVKEDNGSLHSAVLKFIEVELNKRDLKNITTAQFNKLKNKKMCVYSASTKFFKNSKKEPDWYRLPFNQMKKEEYSFPDLIKIAGVQVIDIKSDGKKLKQLDDIIKNLIKIAGEFGPQFKKSISINREGIDREEKQRFIAGQDKKQLPIICYDIWDFSKTARSDDVIHQYTDLTNKYFAACNKYLSPFGYKFEFYDGDWDDGWYCIEKTGKFMHESLAVGIELPKTSSAISGHAGTFGAYTRDKKTNTRKPYIPDTTLPQGTGRKIGTDVMTDESAKFVLKEDTNDWRNPLNEQTGFHKNRF